MLINISIFILFVTSIGLVYQLLKTKSNIYANDWLVNYRDNI